MAVTRKDWDFWEDQAQGCLETVREADDYETQAEALRTLKHLVLEAEDQLEYEQFAEGRPR